MHCRHAHRTTQVLELLRLDDRDRIARMCAAELAISRAEFDALPSLTRQVAMRQGVPAFLDEMRARGGGSSNPAAHGEPFYWDRQYLFVGATIPDTGARGVAT